MANGIQSMANYTIWMLNNSLEKADFTNNCLSISVSKILTIVCPVVNGPVKANDKWDGLYNGSNGLIIICSGD